MLAHHLQASDSAKESAELREHVQSQQGRLHMLQKQIHERDRHLQKLQEQLQQQQQQDGGERDGAVTSASTQQQLVEQQAQNSRLQREVKASKQQAQNARKYIDQYSESPTCML